MFVRTIFSTDVMDLLTILIFLVFVSGVYPHAKLVEPPGRSSMWRYGFPTPINYNDNQLYCGGYRNTVLNDGKCGACGDPYQGPYENEAGGKYATGIIGRHYSQDDKVINVTVDVTAHHMGYFEFKICPHNNIKERVKQSCLDKYLLKIQSLDRSQGNPYKHYMHHSTKGKLRMQLEIPEGLRCNQCVLQWRYTTGNFWGVSPNGTSCRGCGPQEQFVNCADISIGHTQESGDRVEPGGNDMTVKPKTYNEHKHHPPTISTQYDFLNTSKKESKNCNRCYALPTWKHYPNMDDWCDENCKLGNCPPCRCYCGCPDIKFVNPCKSKGDKAGPTMTHWCWRECCENTCPADRCECTGNITDHTMTIYDVKKQFFIAGLLYTHNIDQNETLHLLDKMENNPGSTPKPVTKVHLYSATNNSHVIATSVTKRIKEIKKQRSKARIKFLNSLDIDDDKSNIDIDILELDTPRNHSTSKIKVSPVTYGNASAPRAPVIIINKSRSNNSEMKYDENSGKNQSKSIKELGLAKSNSKDDETEKVREATSSVLSKIFPSMKEPSKDAHNLLPSTEKSSLNVEMRKKTKYTSKANKQSTNVTLNIRHSDDTMDQNDNSKERNSIGSETDVDDMETLPLEMPPPPPPPPPPITETVVTEMETKPPSTTPNTVSAEQKLSKIFPQRPTFAPSTNIEHKTVANAAPMRVPSPPSTVRSTEGTQKAQAEVPQLGLPPPPPTTQASEEEDDTTVTYTPSDRKETLKKNSEQVSSSLNAIEWDNEKVHFERKDKEFDPVNDDKYSRNILEIPLPPILSFPFDGSDEYHNLSSKQELTITKDWSGKNFTGLPLDRTNENDEHIIDIRRIEPKTDDDSSQNLPENSSFRTTDVSTDVMSSTPETNTNMNSEKKILKHTTERVKIFFDIPKKNETNGNRALSGSTYIENPWLRNTLAHFNEEIAMIEENVLQFEREKGALFQQTTVDNNVIEQITLPNVQGSPEANTEKINVLQSTEFERNDRNKESYSKDSVSISTEKDILPHSANTDKNTNSDISNVFKQQNEGVAERLDTTTRKFTGYIDSTTAEVSTPSKRFETTPLPPLGSILDSSMSDMPTTVSSTSRPIRRTPKSLTLNYTLQFIKKIPIVKTHAGKLETKPERQSLSSLLESEDENRSSSEEKSSNPASHLAGLLTESDPDHPVDTNDEEDIKKTRSLADIMASTDEESKPFTIGPSLRRFRDSGLQIFKTLFIAPKIKKAELENGQVTIPPNAPANTVVVDLDLMNDILELFKRFVGNMHVILVE